MDVVGRMISMNPTNRSTIHQKAKELVITLFTIRNFRNKITKNTIKRSIDSFTSLPQPLSTQNRIDPYL